MMISHTALYRATIVIAGCVLNVSDAEAQRSATIYAPATARNAGVVLTKDGDRMLDVVPLKRRKLVSSEFKLDGVTLRLGVDYVPFDPGVVTRPIARARVIYAGFIEDTTNQITREQAAGRVVVFRTRAKGAMTMSVTPGGRWSDAAAIVTINSDGGFSEIRDVGRMTSMIVWPDYVAEGSIPVSIAVTGAAAARMFGSSGVPTEPGALGGLVDGSFVYSTESEM